MQSAPYGTGADFFLFWAFPFHVINLLFPAKSPRFRGGLPFFPQAAFYSSAPRLFAPSGTASSHSRLAFSLHRSNTRPPPSQKRNRARARLHSRMVRVMPSVRGARSGCASRAAKDASSRYLPCRHGELSPVFFGSALTNFGVEPFLKEFLRLTPAPLPRKDAASGELVDPCSEQFSGFVFKIQANMNKNHRDRIAFLRICSGKFERGMEAFHVQEGKNIKLATGTSLMADDRAIVSEAYAGDIIGLFDPGIFSIGDTLCTGKKHVQFAGIPTFAPEHFARVTQVDTMKRKQFVKGMEQIAQEGAIQIFRDLGSGMEEVIVGVVGVLQLEVLEYRLKNEYNVDIRMQSLPYEHLRWILNDPDELDIKHLDLTSDTRAIEDMKGNPLLLFGSPWSINWAEQHNETLKLSEFGNLTF